ncbi:MAG: DUF1080 domain-containing protein [Kiritimatiellae bacterium]|nr:DUF1080 domain-containing protein [Kiritimatiellia bacterium]
MAQIGYTDTPFIQGSTYRVHDAARPQPRVVTPGTFSTQTRPGLPPSDAVVLFDGASLDGWLSCKDGGPAGWKVGGGCMQVVPGTGSIRTRAEFGSCQLHVEFAEPKVVKGESQGRGNSGVFLMRRYEVQVLDCYQNPTYSDGTTGAIYGQFPPLVNACRQPGEWSCYDIVWEAPVFDGDRLAKPAFLTVMLNGLILHNRQELLGPTQHRALAKYEPHPARDALELQDHGDLVRFRNIWYRPLTAYDQA